MTATQSHISESKTRRGKTLSWFVALAVVAAVAGGAYWWFAGLRERQLTALADAATVDLPEAPADSTPTLEFLAGPGAGLVAAARNVDWKAITPASEECRDAAEMLDGVDSPTALRAAAETVPDAATSDVAKAFVDSSIMFVGECLAGNEPEPDDVRFSAQVWERQLERLGA